MDKVKLEFKLPENKTIRYQDTLIEISPFLTLAQQVAITNHYVSDYFGEAQEPLIVGTPYNLLEAETNLKFHLLQIVTNIDTDNLDNDVLADSALFDEITSNIINYSEFRGNLNYIVGEIKDGMELDNSAGKVFSNFMEKAYTMLDKLSNISPEEIDKLQKTGVELVERLEASSVLGNNPAEKTSKKIQE